MPVTYTDQNIEQLVEAARADLSFGLLWNDPEPRDIMYVSQLYTLPARDKVGVLPVIDAEGNPIPGSLFIQDIKGADEDEGRIVFDARKAIVHWLGLPERLRGIVYPKPKSYLYLAGLRLLPKNPTKAQWKAVREAGMAANEEYHDIMAKQEISSWHRHKQRFGADSQPFDERYESAMRRLKRRQSRLDEADVIKLGLEEQLPEVTENELELRVFMEAELMKIANKTTLTDAASKVALVQKMLEDVSVRRQLQKSYSIRKRGHVPEKEDEMEAAYQNQLIKEAKATALGAKMDSGVESGVGVET